jgi:transposase
MVFSWRRRFAEIPEASSSPFVPVVVTPDAPMARAPAPSDDMIEIELARGYRVRIGRGVKAAALRLVLDALERR